MSAISPSSLPKIPQSVARPAREAVTKNPLFPAIQATPTRKPVSSSQPASNLPSVPPIDYGTSMPSSPLQPRRASGQLLTVVPKSAVKNISRSSFPQGIQETPIKKRAEATLGHSHPAAPTPSSENSRGGRGRVTNDGIGQVLGTNKEDDSIYKSLGWDDADDTDDLA